MWKGLDQTGVFQFAFQVSVIDRCRNHARYPKRRLEHHHCQQHFPKCLQGLDAHQQQEWARACQRNAARQGYSTEDEMLRWVGLYAAFGDGFPDGPGQGVYRQLLSARDASPEQRLTRLFDELNRQCTRGEITL